MGWRERTAAHLRDTHGWTARDFDDAEDHIYQGDLSAAHIDIHEAARELRGTSLADDRYVPGSGHRHD